MKICYLANTAIPSTNASAIQITKMCEAFSKLKNDVLLISTNVSSSNIFSFYDIKSKFKFEKIKYFKKFPLGIRFYIFSILSIIKSFKFKPDIYITRNFFTCFLLTILRKKIIFELHHDLNTESRIVRFLVKYFDFLNSTCIKKIVGITEGVKKAYVKKYNVNKNKILVIPSGSSLKINFNFKHNKKKFKIGYFGSLYKSRGLNLIYELAKIDGENKYYIYGNIKNIKNSQKNAAIKNLNLYDHIPYNKISKTLSEMDILLIPYVSSITVAGDVSDITKYTSPLKLFDYLSAGKIIICSDYEVLKEVINEKKNAIFIKNYKNVFAWRNEIKKLKYQYNKQIIFSKNNYLLSKKYSLINRANKILKEIV
tara:strand:- start:92 stop:1195 length:1104 start_codon:yes stop_codon:yes gene_type:complete